MFFDNFHTLRLWHQLKLLICSTQNVNDNCIHKVLLGVCSIFQYWFFGNHYIVENEFQTTSSFISTEFETRIQWIDNMQNISGESINIIKKFQNVHYGMVEKFEHWVSIIFI